MDVFVQFKNGDYMDVSNADEWEVKREESTETLLVITSNEKAGKQKVAVNWSEVLYVARGDMQKNNIRHLITNNKCPNYHLCLYNLSISLLASMGGRYSFEPNCETCNAVKEDEICESD